MAQRSGTAVAITGYFVIFLVKILSCITDCMHNRYVQETSQELVIKQLNPTMRSLTRSATFARNIPHL